MYQCIINHPLVYPIHLEVRKHMNTKLQWWEYIHKYHWDNGDYKSKLFSDDLEKRHQTISLYSVGSHGQNVVVEMAIQKMMMLYQALIWPTHFDMMLWPFALNHAAYLWNHLPIGYFQADGGLEPVEIYTSSKMDMSRLRVEKTWGCQAYILDPRL